MTNKPKEMEDEEVVEVFKDDNLKNLWIDAVQLFTREDNICFMRMLTNLPAGFYEQARIITDEYHLKEIINVICQQMNYFPTKPDDQDEGTENAE